MLAPFSTWKETGSMQIHIQSLDFALTHALGKYAERRLKFALAQAGDRIGLVKVRLSDIHGPRGGIDKHCCIHVMLTGSAAVMIKDTQASLYLAIDRAIAVAKGTAERLDYCGVLAVEFFVCAEGRWLVNAFIRNLRMVGKVYSNCLNPRRSLIFPRRIPLERPV